MHGKVDYASGQRADSRRHVAIKAIPIPQQDYITEGIIHDITVDSTAIDTNVVENLANLQRKNSVLSVLCRTVHRKLRTANEQQKNVFQSRLSRMCVKWKYIPAKLESQMKPKRGETLHLDTSATRVINDDMTASDRRRTYRERDVALNQKMSHRQTRNARRLLHHRIGAGVSKRSADSKEPVATTTEKYDAEGIALTPLTFYTFYNKSSKFFVKDHHFFPVTGTTLPTTKRPQSPHILRTSGSSGWKTVNLRKVDDTNPDAHSIDTPPGDNVGSRSVETSIQSPSSVTETTEQTTTPLVASSNETTTMPPDWNTDDVDAETSMATATAFPLDGGTHNSSSHTQDVDIDAPNLENYSQNASTADPGDDDLLVQNFTTDGATVYNDTPSDVLENNHTTESIVTTPAVTHNANTPTRETSQSTTTFIRWCWLPWEPTSARKQTPPSTTTTIPFAPVTNTYVNNTTIVPSVRFTSAKIAGIITGSLAIFWLILGPFVCFVCHVMDQANKRRQRQRDDELGHRLVHELIRTEMAKGRSKIYKTDVNELKAKPLPPEPKTNGDCNAKGPTCVTVV